MRKNKERCQEIGYVGVMMMVNGLIEDLIIHSYNGFVIGQLGSVRN